MRTRTTSSLVLVPGLLLGSALGPVASGLEGASTDATTALTGDHPRTAIASSSDQLARQDGGLDAREATSTPLDAPDGSTSVPLDPALQRLSDLLDGPVPPDLPPRVITALGGHASELGPDRVRDFLDAVILAGDELAAWSQLARTQVVAPLDGIPGPERQAAVATLASLISEHPGTEIAERAEQMHFRLTRLARGCRPPWFTITDPLGNQVRSTDLIGQAVLVRVMGDAGPLEDARLAADVNFSRAHWDEPLTMIGVASDEDPRALYTRLQARGVHWPVGWEPATTTSELGVRKRWRLEGEGTFLIGPNGRIAGFELDPAEVEARLAWVLGQAPVDGLVPDAIVDDTLVDDQSNGDMAGEVARSLTPSRGTEESAAALERGAVGSAAAAQVASSIARSAGARGSTDQLRNRTKAGRAKARPAGQDAD